MMIKELFIVWAEFGENEAAFDTLTDAFTFANSSIAAGVDPEEVLISRTKAAVYALPVEAGGVEACRKQCDDAHIFGDDAIPVAYDGGIAFYSIADFYDNVLPLRDDGEVLP